MKKLLVRSALVIIALLVMAAPVLATTKAYSFTMDQRYVSGKRNGITHYLNAGNLTNNGVIWVYSIDPGAIPSPPAPYDVVIEVWKDEIADNLICGTTVTPYSTLNKQKSFSKSCGYVPSGYYYIVAYKATGTDDGWNIRGSGTLTTN